MRDMLFLSCWCDWFGVAVVVVGGMIASYYNDLMRLHFQRLTAFFLLPLEQYFASLIPPANTISPFKPPPRIAAFSEENFLKSLCRGK